MHYDAVWRLTSVGEDSPFGLCWLLGSAPQELNNMRPEAKLLIREARARNPNRFFSALAVDALLPASGNRSNYSHGFFVDTPRCSRYIAYLRYATILYWRMQVLLPYGGHQKVIDVVGDGTKLLLTY
jgi:hypothetical protein